MPDAIASSGRAVIPAAADALEQAIDDMVSGTFGPQRSEGIDQWLSTHSRAAIAERSFNELDRLGT